MTQIKIEKILNDYGMKFRLIGNQYAKGTISYDEYLAKTDVLIIETGKNFRMVEGKEIV